VSFEVEERYFFFKNTQGYLLRCIFHTALAFSLVIVDLVHGLLSKNEKTLIAFTCKVNFFCRYFLTLRISPTCHFLLPS
jgi:hypothetical protein